MKFNFLLYMELNTGNNIINRIKSVLLLKEINYFINNFSELHYNNKGAYKSWIGFNYSKEGCVGIKLYFTSYAELSINFLNKILTKDELDLYIEDYKKRNIKAIFNEPEYGSGISFGLKIDNNNFITKGFGFNLNLEEKDLKVLSSQKISRDDVLQHKGVYHHISNNVKYIKSYYYLKNNYFKEKILSSLNFLLYTDIPILEIGFGKGFYENSNSNDYKLILLGNYEEVWNKYYDSNLMFDSIKKDFSLLKNNYNINAYCPAVYDSGLIQSFYILSKADVNGNIKTIESFLE